MRDQSILGVYHTLPDLKERSRSQSCVRHPWMHVGHEVVGIVCAPICVYGWRTQPAVSKDYGSCLCLHAHA